MRKKAEKAVSIASLHSTFMTRMATIPSRLGAFDTTTPPAPDCGAGLSASFSLKLPTKGLKCMGTYIYRGERYSYQDIRSFDDRVTYEFKLGNPHLSYSDLLLHDFPEVILAFGAYNAYIDYGFYYLGYTFGYNPDTSYGLDSTGNEIRNNPVYNELVSDPTVNTASRWFIFCLSPAQYWSEEFCNKALGYGKDEVIRRLEGQVRLVLDWADGVYFVLNDNPDLTFNEFVEMNTRYKKILGLK